MVTILGLAWPGLVQSTEQVRLRLRESAELAARIVTFHVIGMANPWLYPFHHQEHLHAYSPNRHGYIVLDPD